MPPDPRSRNCSLPSGKQRRHITHSGGCLLACLLAQGTGSVRRSEPPPIRRRTAVRVHSRPLVSVRLRKPVPRLRRHRRLRRHQPGNHPPHPGDRHPHRPGSRCPGYPPARPWPRYGPTRLWHGARLRSRPRRPPPHGQPALRCLSPRSRHLCRRHGRPCGRRPTRTGDILTCFLPASAEDWPRFRGPNGTGVSTSRNMPVKFGPAKNLVWRAPLPPGHPSPCAEQRREAWM